MDAIKHILEHADLAKPYNAREVEEPLYAWWEQQGFFQPRAGRGPRSIHDRDPAAQRHRTPAHRPRPDVDDRGYSDPLAPYVGRSDPVGAGNRPCRYRHAERGRA